MRSTSASFGKPLLSLILTNQCLTIMVRSGTVINVVRYDDIAHVRIQRGIGGPNTLLENNKYVHGFLKKLAFGPPPPWKKFDTPPPPGK